MTITLTVTDCLNCETTTASINDHVIVDAIPYDIVVEYDPVDVIRRTLHAMDIQFNEEEVDCGCVPEETED